VAPPCISLTTARVAAALAAFYGPSLESVAPFEAGFKPDPFSKARGFQRQGAKTPRPSAASRNQRICTGANGGNGERKILSKMRNSCDLHYKEDSANANPSHRTVNVRLRAKVANYFAPLRPCSAIPKNCAFSAKFFVRVQNAFFACLVAALPR